MNYRLSVLSTLFVTGLMAASGLAAPIHPTGTDPAVHNFDISNIDRNPAGVIEGADIPGFAGLDGFFARNDGQVGNAEIRYTYCSAGVNFAFMDSAVLMVLMDGQAPEHATAIKLAFGGSNPVAPDGREELPHYSNYFLGDDPSCWRAGVPSFGKIAYEGVYEGIDLVYHFNGEGLKYDWKVAPHADPEAIVEIFEGAGSLFIGPGGELRIVTRSGALELPRPVCYQYIDNERREVQADFDVVGNSLRYRIGQYDEGCELVIDPLIFSTFLGSSGTEHGTAVAVDPNGSVYVTGFTSSSGFPTTNGVYDRTYQGAEDIFVSKLSADGSRLDWSTFVGGSGDDAGYGIEPCPNGDIVVSAYSYSSDFPTTSGCYDNSWNGGCDQTVFVLSSDASTLKRSTFIGGSGWDHGRLTVASDGDFLICGYTTSGDYPTTNGAYDTTHNGGSDIFVTELKSDCSALVLSTFIGGSGNDEAWYTTSAFDLAGNIYVCGHTDSRDFPTTPGCYDNALSSGNDAFVLKLDPGGTTLQASTYIGGASTDYCTGVLIAPDGDVFIQGSTVSNDFPTTAGAFDTSLSGGFDIFVCRFDGDLTTLKGSTFVGGKGEEWSRGLAMDSAGNFNAGGLSYSGDFPTTAGSYDSTLGGSADAILYRLSPDLTKLLNSTYLGGSNLDEGTDMKMDLSDNMYLCGRVESPDFPVTNGAYDTSYNGARDCGILEFRFLTNVPPKWLALPTFNATEDVPFTQNFSRFVSDADTPVKDLRITSTSPYVPSVSDLNVTFLFPEGVLTAKVPLNVSDGDSMAGTYVQFKITPVNDPPICSIGKEQSAVEDVQKTIDFAPFVSDVDNPGTDLGLLVNDPFATTNGLKLIVLFPNEVVKHTVAVNVSDGHDSTGVRLNFTIKPVDDPPGILSLPSFVAIEDRISVFNLTPFVQDEDTPLQELTLTLSEPNCSVDGLEMRFMFSKGGIEVEVPFEVKDAESTVQAVLMVCVTEVNDPPVVTSIPPKLIVEDAPTILNLSVYIQDEDTPRDRLVLETRDPNVVMVEGLSITVLFSSWRQPYDLVFTVSDGIAKTNGSLGVQVEEVNDPPIISGIGGIAPPVNLTLDEGGELWLPVNASDEEDARLKYSLTSTWAGITVLDNGTVRVKASRGEVGNFMADLKVEDGRGGMAIARIMVTVRNVNDPPTLLKIIQPTNHTMVEEGTNLTFSINVSDPDLQYGQVLTARWVSNISGVLRTLNSTRELSFVTNTLNIGTHRITVSVTDGQYTKEAWLEVVITPKHMSSVPRPGGDSLPFMMIVAGIAVVVVAAVLAVAYISRRAKRHKAAQEDSPMPVPPPSDVFAALAEIQAGPTAFEGSGRDVAQGPMVGNMPGEMAAPAIFPGEGQAMPAEERQKKLEKLEELLLDGKVSEATYLELKRKYEGKKLV